MKVTIEGIPPWDGDYEFPDLSFTNRELHEIKKLSGVRAGELFDALVAGDAAVDVAVTCVILARSDKHVDPDDLWDAEGGAITFDFRTAGGDADPPTTPPPGSGTTGSGESSGPGSRTDGG